MNKIQIKEVAGNIVATMGTQEHTMPRNHRLSFFEDVFGRLNGEITKVYPVIFGSELSPCDEDVFVEIQYNGSIYHWAWNLAHYCFAKGRLTEEEFVGLIKKS